MQPICIIGTDTGIGKTYTCCKIMQYLISQNRTTTTLKPISSGVNSYEYGLLNPDVYELYMASNYKLDFNQINPFKYPLAVAPHIAAKQHGSTLNVKLVTNQMQKIFNAITHTNKTDYKSDINKINNMHSPNTENEVCNNRNDKHKINGNINFNADNNSLDHVLIEGVGGLMVPLNTTETFLDLLTNWDYPIILVVGMKLGCLNHTLLTLQTLQQKKLTILGWVANQIETQMPCYHENIEYLIHKLEELAVPLLATIAYQGSLQPTLKFKELFKCNQFIHKISTQESSTWFPAAKPDTDNNQFNLEVIAAQGSYLVTAKYGKIYDAISSWWCKPLGHCHPIITKSIEEQLKLFEHHIPAKSWDSNIEKLSKRLVQIFTQMDKVMYASDGSSAVEIAMKLSYETRVLEQQSYKNKYIALNGAYHGETIFTLGVCGIKHYTTNYSALLQDNYFIDDIPYVNGQNDPLWLDCNFDYNYWNNFFTHAAQNATALIIEPLVQGAAGMKIISRDFLIKIINLARNYNLHIIVDEIMAGLGRLGCYSVSKELLNFEPDIVCLAKNLTAGAIPMSAVIINHSISQVFRNHQKPFLHSHTHSCNGLAAAAANSYLDYLDNSNLLDQVKLAEIKLIEIMNDLKNNFTFIKQTRVIGAIAALELNLSISMLEDIFNIGIKEQIYLRPIENTLYIMPPIYNINHDLELIQGKLYLVLQELQRINTLVKKD